MNKNSKIKTKEKSIQYYVDWYFYQSDRENALARLFIKVLGEMNAEAKFSEKFTSWKDSIDRYSMKWSDIAVEINRKGEGEHINLKGFRVALFQEIPDLAFAYEHGL